MLERYGHGGDLWTAEETFGWPKDQFLDFSSNMNPLGPPLVVQQILSDAWRDIVKYPDPAVRELRSKLAQKYEIPMESILVGNGAAELIDLIARVLKPSVTGLARPSFSEYEEAIHKTGGGIYNIPLRSSHQFELQQQDMEAAYSAVDLFFLGHPNNPTGKLIPRHILSNLIESGRSCVLDEAFMDFVADEQEHSLLKLASTSRQLFVIRSMTKFYSIPGIRLGFMVAHPEAIREIQQQQVQWSVNYLAQRIGTAVLEDEKFERNSRHWLQEEKAWLTGQLRQLGLDVVFTEVNFVLFSFPEPMGLTVKQAQKYMGQQGILIRDASLFEGLSERYCRVAIRLREDNVRLIEGLRLMLAAFGAESRTKS
ncbi:threonine-phosphate decarboxylase CobD [Paenibacillus aceris]|uniref:threonine-phosphate decarboxylase n=1 Tax=Paenibacillus aceris TaxID=869555 RepID=A0ABS4HW20_9BACL|nr:threonine-phosphate decarboxylase CobD [Paenibacillus aceris]MBP1962421.1 threonine-phosphate decarboxylase [Paenibacillus aceris]NHW37236.1 threonine-phosphate decarboxylase [Paenibacillus aceris]